MAIKKFKNGDKLSLESINNNYSTTEQIIGTWINGKPLYRVVLQLNGDYQAGTNQIDTGLSGCDQLIHAYGMFRRGTGGVFNIIPNNYTNWETYIYDFNGISSFKLRFDENQVTAGIHNVIIILEYTKNN